VPATSTERAAPYRLVDPPSGFAPPEVRPTSKRLTERAPWLYPAAVFVLQQRRRLQWATSRSTWAVSRSTQPLPLRVKRHRSLLLRELGESEMALQHGKVTNLRLATARVDGILLRPGETFSFNRVVGNCTRRGGYVEGMRLSGGEAFPGVGGGICALANLLHWMVLHSPLTVTERSDHTFDPFPDNGRVLPWGVGCSIAYNYVDFAFRNDTDVTFQIRVSVGERYLEGELLASGPLPHSYRVYAADEQFLLVGSDFLRRNEIRRRVIDRKSGQQVADEPVKRNCALVRYVPSGVDVIDCTQVT
jgi:vancomycin resistance protein VanW